jgi:exodeoxyribonuclease VII small subunit
MDKEHLEELQKLPFEKALEKLESIVSKMENGQLPLDDMMKAYEEGQALSSACSKKLKSIEKKVEILQKKADGQGKWEDFDSTGEQPRTTPVQEKIAEPIAEELEEDLLF